MGTRWNARVDRGIDAFAVRPLPISLTPAEVDIEKNPPRQPREPIPVRAWVRFHEATVRPEGVAVAFTDKAVLVRWESIDGRQLQAWVWASAVERLPGG